MRSLAVLALSFALALPAGAADLAPREEAQLAQGRPFVEVRADPDGESGLIRAAIDVAARRRWSGA